MYRETGTSIVSQKKTCPQCKIEKPLDEFCKDPGRSKYGRRGKCIECRISNGDASEKVLHAILVARYEAKEGRKVCTKCLMDLPISWFSMHTKRDGRLMPSCKVCQAKDKPFLIAKLFAADEGKRWCNKCKQAKDHDCFRVARGQCRDCAAKASLSRAAKMDQSQRDHKNKLARDWRKRNPEKVKASLKATTAKRRASDGAGDVCRDAIIERIADQGHKCAYCGCDISGKFHADHVVPLSRGGKNSMANLAGACESCNCQKKDKLLTEWVEHLIQKQDIAPLNAREQAVLRTLTQENQE